MQPEIMPPRLASGPFGWLALVSWGHGMIGKATVAVIALIVLLSIIAARIPSENGMLIVGGAAILAIFVYLFFLSNFARNYADVAATEGPTYVQAQQIALAAKGVSRLPVTEIVPDPQSPTLLDQPKTSDGNADG
jgi:hypothetical protein